MLPGTLGIFALSGSGLRATAEMLQLLVGLHGIQKGEYLCSSYNVKKKFETQMIDSRNLGEKSA